MLGLQRAGGALRQLPLLWAAAAAGHGVASSTGSLLQQGLALPAVNPSCQARAASSGSNDVHSTTVLCVRKDGEVVLIADGQVIA